MKFNPSAYHRRSIRLQGYDYSQAGAYFVTLCAHERKCLFGEIANGEMRLSDAGNIVADEWIKTPEIRNEIELDSWVVMPNHFHAIIVIAHDYEGGRRVAPTGPKTRSIGAVMAGFKAAVTQRVNKLQKTPGIPLWQRNYWERVIRDESECNEIREYIHNNPAQWKQDKLHP